MAPPLPAAMGTLGKANRAAVCVFPALRLARATSLRPQHRMRPLGGPPDFEELRLLLRDVRITAPEIRGEAAEVVEGARRSRQRSPRVGQRTDPPSLEDGGAIRRRDRER